MTHAARRRAWWHDTERGDVAISVAILWPVMLALVWLCLQTGLYFYGRQVALAAAEQGAQAARTEPVSTARADDAATRFVASVGGAWVANPQVTAELQGDAVRVTVRGDAISLLPGITFGIEQESVMPLERIAP